MILGLNGQPMTGPIEKVPESVLWPLRHFEPARQGELLTQLKARAGADDHVVIAPTHVMLRGGDVIGYLSIAGMPTVHAWFDSTIKNPRHSRNMIAHGETALRESGVRQYFVCCAKSSPFFPRMAELGFQWVGETNFFAKSLIT